MRKLKHQDIKRLSAAEYKVSRRHPVSVLVDNIRSAHNVGSILRTSDASGVEHVYLSGITPDIGHKMVHKTALGAQDIVPTSRTEDSISLLASLKNKGYTIAALELTDSPSEISDISYSQFPLLLIVGNELSGVSPELIEKSDLALEIPQYGTKQSLNVSVAFGIAIFGLVSRYRSLSSTSA